MSSMFKKKGGPAFKPKIPSARPRPAAPPRPAKPAPRPSISEAAAEPSTEDGAASSSAQNPSTATVDTPTSSEAPPTAQPTENPAQPSETEPQDGTSTQPDTQSPVPGPTEQRPAPDSEGNTVRDADQAPTLGDASVPVPSTEVAVSTPAPLPAPVASPAPSPAVEVAAPSPRPDAAPVPTPGQDVAAAPDVSANIAEHPTPAPDAQKDTDAATDPPSSTNTTDPTTSVETDVATSQGGEPSESGAAAKPARKPRARKLNEDGSVRPRKRRARSVTPEDAEEQQVDLQKLKMSDLTRDLHIGKKFSRHDELRERERKARMKAKLEKVTSQSESGREGSSTPAIEQQGANSTSTPAPAAAPDAAAASAPASGPQFRIVDGQIIVDQSSLVMDRHARAAAAQAGEDMETVEENDFTRLITSSSFMNSSKLRGPNLWTPDETELFYHGLRMFGTDFQIIATTIPGKSRRAVKLKFNREERQSPALVNAALVGLKTVKMDMDEYQAACGTKLESVESIEAEQRKIQEGFEAERQRVIDEQAEAMRKKREELFADDDNAADAGANANGKPGKRKKGKKGGKAQVAYGLNGEPITSTAD